MNKTRIEWCDYTINPVKGLCPMHCKNLEGYEYCYAAGERGLYKRFKWNPEIRFDADELLKTRISDHESYRIFWGSTMELFGNWINPAWLQSIFNYIYTENDLNTHIFLTKQPQNLIKWSPFPENCWVGVSVCDEKMLEVAGAALGKTRATIRFLSVEPMLGRLDVNYLGALLVTGWVNWLIIGQQTPVKKATMPKVGWVEEIVQTADKENIPVFLKDNLISCVDQYEFALKDGKYRQEFPK